MKNAWLIARRDFRNYFTSPIAYIVIASFLGIVGYMFFLTLRHFLEQSMQYQQYNMGRSVSVIDGVVAPLYQNVVFMFLFVIPFITMRLFAEERKNQTFSLLITSPVKLSEIVLGKFLSSLMLITVMIALTLTYPAFLLMSGNPDPGPIVASVIGTLLMGGALLSVGVLFSSVTENQIVAAVLTFLASIFLWIVSWAAYSAGPVWADILSYLSMIMHFRNFTQGILNTSDVLYFLSFIFVCLFLTHRVLDSYRWR